MRVAMSNPYLRRVVPLVARAARTSKDPMMDRLLEDLLRVCAQRGLRSIIAEVERILLEESEGNRL